MPNLSLQSDIIVPGKKSQFILPKKMFSEWILTGDKKSQLSYQYGKIVSPGQALMIARASNIYWAWQDYPCELCDYYRRSVVVTV